jgi:hypothetical protein
MKRRPAGAEPVVNDQIAELAVPTLPRATICQ